MAYTLRVCAGSIQIQFTDYNYKGAEGVELWENQKGEWT